MTTIALTGGIASGKSTISERLRELGAVVLDADRFARDAVEPGTRGLQKIREHFGERVIRPDGTLDRAALAAIVFHDEDERKVLNDITHPEIARLTNERKAAIRAEDPEAVIVHDIALLAEGRFNYDYDEIWVADAPASERLRRLVEERGMDAVEARGRIEAQVSDDERRAIADVIIDTAVPLAETLAQVDDLWAQLDRHSVDDRTTERYGA